ncbi:DEAD/DEAH box helicase [Pseudactinotalea sp. Z1748]|uniref:DEAD/DEAH box helicase n=1 Tax=Pseudactinotalea sp. Z1748 TaxID=3413027 RepID=UPI003C7C91C8
MPDASTPATSNFADLGLAPHLLTAITEMGYREPTQIQTAAIPPLLAGRDVTGVAQTGTGKTAAFGLPLLAAVDADRAGVQALVLTPTRELAIQVADALTQMASTSPGLDVLPIYGGASYVTQLRALKSGTQVVVGTPGRVIDLAERGSLDLSGVSYLVLDEADEMLRMGFAEDVEVILTHTGTDTPKQVALFSATMPSAIRKVAREHLNNPVELATSAPSSTTTMITQTYAVVPFRHKVGALSRVLATTAADATLVFVRTRDTAEEVALELTARGTPAASISGDVPQRERERIVQRLRSGGLDVLIATDVAARGLDVDRIGLVVNFDVPREVEAYVHRIGRTGRAGRSGTALTFFTPRERNRLTAIERVTGSSLQEVDIPTPAQVSKHRAQRVLAELGERIGRGRLDLYREQLQAYTDDGAVEPLEVAAALLALQVGDDGPAPRQDRAGGESGTLGVAGADRSGAARRPGAVAASAHTGRDERPARARFDSARSGADRPMTRRTPGRTSRGTVYRVAVGHTHGARPEAIVGAITNEGGLRGSDLGKIEIFSRFSLVEVNAQVTDEASRRLDRAVVAGRPMHFRPDTGAPGGTADRGGARPRRTHDAGSGRRAMTKPARAAKVPTAAKQGRKPRHTAARTRPGRQR